MISTHNLFFALLQSSMIFHMLTVMEVIQWATIVEVAMLGDAMEVSGGEL